MTFDSISYSIKKLHKFCVEEKYIGYSLYDSHNSFLPFRKLGKFGSFYVNQVLKRSPLNFRPILGVKKGINPKGYGLFLQAYSILADCEIIDKKEASEKARFFFEWLQSNPSQGYSGHCWGYNYHWPKRDGKDTPAYMPSVVVTGFVARALLCYYERFEDPRVKDILESAANFVINDVHLYRGDDGACFSYTPKKRDKTVNASLLAAEILAYRDYVWREKKYADHISEVVRYTTNHHNPDGSWYYSFDYESNAPKKQIDFHQGYVLESLLRLERYAGSSVGELKQTFQSGLNFYFNRQFDQYGRAYWRYPKRWPIDIHNQSQGIITFALFRNLHPEYLDFSNKIAEWTIKNMQGGKGNFFYQMWPLLKNRVNYLRWNQAWMLVALSTVVSINLGKDVIRGK